MANTLTGLIPTIREGLNTVSREMVGMIPAVWRNPEGKNLQRAAKDQTIRFPIVPQGSLESITPGVNPASSGSQTIAYGDVTISNSKAYPLLWNGEEQLSLANGDKAQVNTILADQFAQGFRTLSNAVETDLAALYVGASNSVGAGGTVPFGTAGDLSDFANAYKIMRQNGAPLADMHMIFGNGTAANIRAKQSGLFKVNEAGSSNLLRFGELGSVQRFSLGESNMMKAHTKGTGTSYTSSTAGFAIGVTSIPIITGSGTVLAGDTVTFAGDTTKYVVKTGVAAPGTIVLAEPGLKKALAASAVAMTIAGTSAEQNMFFDRKAIVLVTRMPALPKEGDSAVDRMTVVDPVSGLAFEISKYLQYKQVKYEIALAWGAGVVKPNHIGLLLS